MKSAVIYARTSTELQEQEKTIQSQIQAVLDYAKQNEYEVIEQYLDDGWSGTLLARPALDKLRDDAAKKIFNSVLIYDPDRLARKYAYQALVLEELEDKGIEVVFLNRPKAESPEDKILQGFQGLFAEYERTKILERTRRGKLHKARSGFIIGNEPPDGLIYIPKTKTTPAHYEINKERAEIIKLIMGWVANDGCSLTELRRRLYKDKILTVGGKYNWQNSTLSRLLRNETYAGTTYWNKTISIVPEKPLEEGKYKRVKKSSRKSKPRADWIPIKVPAIIDEELFLRVQDQLKKNFFFSKRHQKYQYLLSGILFCGSCGSRYTGAGCSRGYRYYRDTNRIRCFPEEKTCNQGSVSANRIEALVWDKISELLNNPKLMMEQLNKLQEKQKNEFSVTVKKGLEIDTQIGKIKFQEQRLLDAYRQEVITIEQFKEQMGKVNEGKDKLEESKAIILKQPEQEIITITPEMIKQYCQLVVKKLPEITFEQKQQLLRLLVDKVILKDKEVTIQGIIPAVEALKDDSQSLLWSNGGSGERLNNGRGGHIFPFSSSIYDSWSWR
jgi:site-specific DNA recombinase